MVAAVVCGGVQRVIRGLIPCSAPACTAQGGLPGSPVDGGTQPCTCLAGTHCLPWWHHTPDLALFS